MCSRQVLTRRGEQARAEAEAIRLPVKCSTCFLKEKCRACAAMVYTESGNYHDVPEYRCRLAHCYASACRQVEAEIIREGEEPKMKRREKSRNKRRKNQVGKKLSRRRLLLICCGVLVIAAAVITGVWSLRPGKEQPASGKTAAQDIHADPAAEDGRTGEEQDQTEGTAEAGESSRGRQGSGQQAVRTIRVREAVNREMARRTAADPKRFFRKESGALHCRTRFQEAVWLSQALRPMTGSTWKMEAIRRFPA